MLKAVILIGGPLKGTCFNRVYFDLRGNWKLSWRPANELCLDMWNEKGARQTVAILARMDLNNITKRKVKVEWWPVLPTMKFVLQKHLSGQHFSVQKIVWPNNEWKTPLYSEGRWGLDNGQSLFVRHTSREPKISRNYWVS